MNKSQYDRIDELKNHIMIRSSKVEARDLLAELKHIADSSPEPEGSIITNLWDALTRFVTRGKDKENIRTFILSDMMRLHNKVADK